MKRALMIAGFTLLVSSALLSFLPETTQWIPAAFFLFFGILTLFFAKKGNIKYISFILIVIAVSGFSLSLTDYISTNNLSEHGEDFIFSGYVSDISTDGFVLKSEIDGKVRSVYVKEKVSEEFQIGKACRVVGELTQTCDMDLSDARYYKSKGCYLVCSPKRAYTIKDTSISYIPKLLKPIWELREKLIWCCEEYFDADVSGVLKAILLGDRRDVPNIIDDDFETAGISYYIVLSGQHTGIIAAALFFVLRGINKRFAAIITACSMLFYIFLVGLPPSVVRAGIMVMITYIGIAFFLGSDSLNSLGIAVLVILLVNPYSSADVSLQLSVVATMGILIISPRINDRLMGLLSKIHPKLKLSLLRKYLITTLSANIALIPYYVFLFDKVSLISPLTNLVVGPIMGIPISFGTLALILFSLNSPGFVFIPVKWIAENALRIIISVSKYVSNFPFSSVASDKTFLKIWVVGTALSLFCLFFLGNKKVIKLAVILSLTSLFSMILCYNVLNKENITVSFCNSYVGTASVVTDKNSCVVIANEVDDFILNSVRKKINSNGKKKIDLMIVAKSHYKEDLLGFLEECEVKNLVYISDDFSEVDTGELCQYVDTYYNNSNIDLSVGQRMEYIVREDDNGNVILYMKLDDVKFALNFGEFDLMYTYNDINDINMFIIGEECPLGIEHFNPEEIFLTNEETARTIYKQIHFITDEINFLENKTILINKNKYKCLN